MAQNQNKAGLKPVSCTEQVLWIPNVTLGPNKTEKNSIKHPDRSIADADSADAARAAISPLLYQTDIKIKLITQIILSLFIQ